MILIVGLGNPGEKYINTRHNIGFKILDSIVEYYDFSLWKKWRNGVLSKGNIGENTVLALKPTTFMNLSGYFLLNSAILPAGEISAATTLILLFFLLYL